MRIKPAMSMFVSKSDLDHALKDWYKERSERLEGLLQDFIREYCGRSGDDDLPAAIEDQRCEIVKNAMKFLNS